MELSKVGTTQATTGFERLSGAAGNTNVRVRVLQAGPLPSSRDSEDVRHGYGRLSACARTGFVLFLGAKNVNRLVVRLTDP
jgi:hypothetical protein